MSDVIFVSHADEVLKDLGSAKEKALEAIGMTAETYAKKMTPVYTGRLMNSISNAVKEDESAVYIGSNVEYAPYVELGARNRQAHHMLRRACTEHNDEYSRLAKEAFENA